MAEHSLPPRPASISGLPTRSAFISPAVPPVPTRKASLPPNYRSKGKSTMPSDESEDEVNAEFTFAPEDQCKDAFNVLREFYQAKQLCDVVIQVGKKSIRCHRVVLACMSRYFRTMFCSEMAESRKEIITIKDIDENALEKLIDFAYTSKITMHIDTVQVLLYASSILQVENVAKACCEFIKAHLHPSNCIGIRNFAELHGRTDLVARADQFILDNFLEVLEAEEFLTLMTIQMMEIAAGSCELNVTSEVQVYEAVMKWIKHNEKDRKKHLPILIAKVKLPLLPPTYLMERVVTEMLLRQNLECRDFLDEAKEYQLSLANVIPLSKMSQKTRPRKSCAGVVFCVGGRGSSGDPFKSIECYDLRRDIWFPVAEMSSRRRHVGVVSVNSKLYAIGGHDGSEHLNSGEVFDPVTNKWTPIAAMDTLRRGIALASLGGAIYAVGGLDDSTCFNNVERYDIESNTWSTVQPMNMPRGGVAIAALKGYLYAVGGNDGAASLDSCERYDPHLDKWTLVAPMNKRRAGAGVAELIGHLYVVGGFDDNAPLNSVEKYDPKENEWTTVAKMNRPRGGVGVATLGGKLYAVGGHDGSQYLSSVEAYDPITDSWSPVNNILVCRAGAGVNYCNVPVNLIEQHIGKNMNVSSCV